MSRACFYGVGPRFVLLGDHWSECCGAMQRGCLHCEADQIISRPINQVDF